MVLASKFKKRATIPEKQATPPRYAYIRVKPILIERLRYLKHSAQLKTKILIFFKTLKI